MTLFVERIDYESGEMYDGEWNEDGRRHGKGCLTFKDGSKYRGQFTAGFFQGLGELVFAGERAKYEGEFQVGKFHGYGVYQSSSGMKYEGQFVDGQVKGKGRITLPDGSHGNPRQEGKFEGERCIERGEAREAVHLAKKAVTQLHSLLQQLN